MDAVHGDDGLDGLHALRPSYRDATAGLVDHYADRTTSWTKQTLAAEATT